MDSLFSDWLANPSPTLLVLVPTLAFLEAAAFIGIFVSGIFLLSTATLLYSTGTSPIVAIVGLAFVGAFLGDLSGYLVGRFFGPGIWHLPLIKRLAHRREKIESLMIRSAPLAIFIGRFTPAIRSVTPIVAGMSGMQTRVYLACDLLAVLLWVTGLYLLVTGLSLFAG
jgi:membrane-associated protein